MKLRMMTYAALGLLLACSASFGAEFKKVKLNIAQPQLRHWPNINAHDETRPRVSTGMLGNNSDRFQFPGTLEECTTYRAHIKDPFTGRIYEIPLYYLSVLDLSYIETRLALNNLPETILDHRRGRQEPQRPDRYRCRRFAAGRLQRDGEQGHAGRQDHQCQ